MRTRPRRLPPAPSVLAAFVLGLLAAGLLAACGASSTASARPRVVAAENFWGSIASQVGGGQVQTTSVIVNPNTDPHDYEVTPADARAVAQAQYVIYNGAGYDPWMDKLLASNPSSTRVVLDVATLIGKKDGDNPHMWYSPSYVREAIGRMAADMKKLSGVDGSAIDRQRTQYESSGLKAYTSLVDSIRQKYAGTPVGATESIFQYLSDALGLDLVTPPAYMKAISEGTDPTPSDKATVDQQVTRRQIKVLVFNSQNATPDVQSVVDKARAEGMPVVEITETLSPANVTFQDWQVKQLRALQRALADAAS